MSSPTKSPLFFAQTVKFTSHGMKEETQHVGVTKREMFAAMFMQAILSRPMIIATVEDDALKKVRENMAMDAINNADLLITKLKETEI